MAGLTVDWEQREAVGWITLNRPESLNAWTAEFGAELRALVEGEAADPLGHRGGRDQPGAGLRERLDVARREVVVVAVRDEDQVRRRRPVGHAVGVEVDRRPAGRDPEAGMAEPLHRVGEHR